MTKTQAWILIAIVAITGAILIAQGADVGHLIHCADKPAYLYPECE